MGKLLAFVGDALGCGGARHRMVGVAVGRASRLPGTRRLASADGNS
jgi:hypothetical protein